MAKMMTSTSRAKSGGKKNMVPKDINKVSAESMGSMTQTPTNDGRPKME